MNNLELLLKDLHKGKRSDLIIRIVNIVRNNPGVKLSDLKERTGYSLKCIAVYIKMLRDRQIITPAFNDKGVRIHGYRVILESVLPEMSNKGLS